jgi:hypothetical protein
MPKFTADMETHNIGGTNFQFSATKIENLGATEYTLVTLIQDASGSVQGYHKEMEACIKEVVRSCQLAPRADNLMLQVILFDTNTKELHGFKPLPNCNLGDYDDCIPDGGMTALYDAVYLGVKATADYGKKLSEQDFSVNATIVVITDGQHNTGKATCTMVAEALKETRTSECLESIMPILVGVGTGGDDKDLDQYLEGFKTEAGFQQYVWLPNANAKTLAKLAGFISRSISSQSKALGTGGASQSLSF